MGKSQSHHRVAGGTCGTMPCLIWLLKAWLPFCLVSREFFWKHLEFLCLEQPVLISKALERYLKVKQQPLSKKKQTKKTDSWKGEKDRDVEGRPARKRGLFLRAILKRDHIRLTWSNVCTCMMHVSDALCMVNRTAVKQGQCVSSSSTPCPHTWRK